MNSTVPKLRGPGPPGGGACLVAVLALFASQTASAAEPLQFKNWSVNRADDGTPLVAFTAANEQAGFGEWCSRSSKSCAWELLINIECKEKESDTVFANSTGGYAALTVECLGKSTVTQLYAYSFKWNDLEHLLSGLNDSSLIAFALPLKDSEFRVVRFSLNGMRDATGMLERRFPKGPQSASDNDQTL